MKKIILLFLPTFLFVIGCFSNSATPAQNSKSGENEKALKELREAFLKPKKEKLELLAIKYKINPEKIEVVIRTYLTKHDNWGKLFEQSENNNSDSQNNSIIETIKVLEKEENIPSDILASIIIDFQMWNTLENCNGSL